MEGVFSLVCALTASLHVLLSWCAHNKLCAKWMFTCKAKTNLPQVIGVAPCLLYMGSRITDVALLLL